MAFSTMSQFFAMGGYGFYIWSAYSIVLLGLLLPLTRHSLRWKKYLRSQQKNNI